MTEVTLQQVALSKLKLQQELANLRTQNLLMLATLHELIATVERMTEQVRLRDRLDEIPIISVEKALRQREKGKK